MRALDRWLGSPVAFWALFGAFVAFYGAALTSLPYTIDEGVSILYSRWIAEGWVPYRDFFYHQFPTQLYFFSWISRIAPDSLFLYRFPSLLSVAGTGWVVHRVALRLVPPPAATFAAFLYYAAPIQYHGMLAIPNGPALFFSSLAVYGVLFHDDRKSVLLGSASLVLAVLVKPLALATILVIGLSLLFDRAQRRKLLPFAAVVGAGGLASFAFLHWLSDGYFTGLLTLLMHPDFSRAIFEAWSSFSLARDVFEQEQIRSFLAWNLHMHRGSLSDPATFAVAAAGAAGAVLVAARPSLLPRERKLLLALWFSVPFLFALFVWKPSFSSYHRQYLPAISILGGLFLWTWWSAGVRRRRAVFAGSLLTAVLCAATVLVGLLDYGPLRALDLRGERVFTMDPFVNFLTGSEPACGLTDPMARVPMSHASPELLERIHERSVLEIVTPEMMIACLEAEPDTRILISTLRIFPLFFLSDALYAYIERQDESRMIWATENDRAALELLFGSGRGASGGAGGKSDGEADARGR